MSQQKPKRKVTKAEKSKKQPKAGNNNPAFISYQNKIREYLKKEGYYYNKKEVEKELQKLSKIAAKQPKIDKDLIFSKWKEQPNQVNKKSPQFWGGVKVQAQKKAKKVKAKKKKLPKEKKQPSKYPKDIRTYYNSLIVNFIDELFKKKLITIEIQYDSQSWVIDTLDKKIAFDTQVFKLMQDFSEYCFKLELDSEFILFPLQEVEEDIFVLWWENIETRPAADFDVDSYFYSMTEIE
jgi:hypothetical protein